MESEGFLGILFIAIGSTGSIPSAIAGNPSEAKFIHRIALLKEGTKDCPQIGKAD